MIIAAESLPQGTPRERQSSSCDPGPRNREVPAGPTIVHGSKGLTAEPAPRSDSRFVDYPLDLAQGEDSLWMGPAGRMTRGHVLPDIWLNIPQAVVLEVTGDLERAKALEARDPHLLLIKAIQLLPPIVSASINADANDAEARSAFRIHVQEADVQTARGGYERGLRGVRDKLINGVTAKGSWAPHLPLEIIDPAEFGRLEFRIVDAVDPRTGKTVWYGVLINARELAEGGSQDLSSSELSRHAHPSDFDDGAQTAPQPGSPTTRRPPLSDRDLRAWYEKRVSELMERGEAASGEADWEAAKQQFGGRARRGRLRELREQLAPVDWKKQGRRSIKAK